MHTTYLVEILVTRGAEPEPAQVVAVRVDVTDLAIRAEVTGVGELLVGEAAWTVASLARSERECEIGHTVAEALAGCPGGAHDRELVRWGVRRDTPPTTLDDWLRVYDHDERWHALRIAELAAERAYRGARGAR